MTFSLVSHIIYLDPDRSQPSVDRERANAHKGLAQAMQNSISVQRGNPRVTHLPADFVERQPSQEELAVAIELQRVTRKGLLAVLDLGTLDFVRLRETFLLALATYVSTIVDEDPSSTIGVVILPVLPPPDSLFWRPLEGRAGDGSIVVIGADGNLQTMGANQKVPDESVRQICHSIGRFSQNPRDALKSRAVRHLGHFDLGEQTCSQYYWEAPNSSGVLAALIVGEVEREQAERPRSWKTWIAVPHDCSKWLLEAAELAADRLGATVKEVPEHSRPVARQNECIVFLLLDFVSRGRHLSTMRKWSGRIPPDNVHALAVFAARDFMRQAHNGLRCFMEISTERISRDSCPQCRIGLPFTSTDAAYPLGIRTYDMWAMLSTTPWDTEPYGPGSQPRDVSFPVMSKLLGTYGSWLSVKLQALVDYVSRGQSLAIVAPDEPAIRYLLQRLPSVQNGTIVSVLIDRALLNIIEEDPMVDPRLVDELSEWGQQLDFVSSRGVVALVCDEFISSGTTFSAIKRVLSAYGIETFALIPVINRSGVREFEGTPIYSLYELPWKRGERIL